MFPHVEDEEFIMEWRYYLTDDSSDDVIDYYKDRMPGYGWDPDDTFCIESTLFNQCVFMKNNEQDMAYVMTASQNGDSIIALVRGRQK
jgi:hypothetical protein